MISRYSSPIALRRRKLVSDSCGPLQALSPILEIRPFAFAIDLAALASRREYLNLEKWLQDRINEHQLEFVQVTASHATASSLL
jgi:hypothetical protein